MLHLNILSKLPIKPGISYPMIKLLTHAKNKQYPIQMKLNINPELTHKCIQYKINVAKLL